VSEVVSVERDGAEAVKAALERTVHSGGVALFPADGLYGLACDPLNAEAIALIHEIKGRDDGKPSAVMYFSSVMMRELLAGLGDATKAVMGAVLPGPYTLVIANPERRYPLACRDAPERLGVRLIDGPLHGANCVIFQTSANRSGEEAPASFEEVDLGIVEAVDLAIDGGKRNGQPSTVVDLTTIDSGGGAKILRQGGGTTAMLSMFLLEGGFGLE